MNTPATATLAGLLALFCAAWLQTFLSASIPEGTATLWLIRQQGLYLSGILSMALMSLVMVLATRPRWLEAPLGGMDRIYRLHKWAGILAVVFAVLHWASTKAPALSARSSAGPGGCARRKANSPACCTTRPRTSANGAFISCWR